MIPKEIAGSPVETPKLRETASMSVGDGASRHVEPATASRPSAPEGRRTVSRFAPQASLQADNGIHVESGKGVGGKSVDVGETASNGKAGVGEVSVFRAEKKAAPQAAPPQVKLDPASPEYEAPEKAFRQWGEALRKQLNDEKPATTNFERRLRHLEWIGLMQEQANKLGLGIMIHD